MSENIISVRIEESRTGLFTATSDALPGVYVAHRDLQKIVDDLPEVITRWFKLHRKQDVTVFKGPLLRRDHSFAVSAIPVPAEIAAQAIGR